MFQAIFFFHQQRRKSSNLSLCGTKLPFFRFIFLFRVFDRDGNGFITRDELQTAMEMMQENVTEKQVTEMLQMADLDKDGKINYEGKWFKM